MSCGFVLLASLAAIRALAVAENVTGTENVTTVTDRYSKGYVRQSGFSDELVDVLDDDLSSSARRRRTPSHKDWHHEGQTSAIKDQGTCGSCWAFATIEEIETAVKRSGGGLHHFSTEELIDCDSVDKGCKGGDPITAVKYLKSKGVATSKDYPNDSWKKGHGSHCTWNKKSAVEITGHSYAIPSCSSSSCGHQSESKLAAAVASHGPMAICINSGEHEAGDWLKYKGGVSTKTCSANGKKVDHCVQLVGYSKVHSTPYWRIRNSWGEGWGEQGFIRIAYGKGNKCCVGCEAIHISAKLKKKTDVVVV